MSQPTAAMKRLSRATRCNCGHWPHDLGCAFLGWVVRFEESGFCPSCGYKLAIVQGFDEHMQCVVTEQSCRNGCRHSLDWTRPTPHDIRRFGLRKAAGPASPREETPD